MPGGAHRITEGSTAFSTSGCGCCCGCCCCCCDMRSGWRGQVAAIRPEQRTQGASQLPAAGMARSSWRPQPAPGAIRRPPVPRRNVLMTSGVSEVLPDTAKYCVSKLVSAAGAKPAGKCACESVPGSLAAAAKLTGRRAQGGAPGDQPGGGGGVGSRLPERALSPGRGRRFWAGSRRWRCEDTSPCRPRTSLPAPRCREGCSRAPCSRLSLRITDLSAA